MYRSNFMSNISFINILTWITQWQLYFTLVCQTWLENFFSFFLSFVVGLTLPAPNYWMIHVKSWYLNSFLYTIAYIQNYPGVSQIQTKSPTVHYESPNHPDKINTSHVKAHKIHFSLIFWLIYCIFCISGEILNEFLRFNLKISTLNNFFRVASEKVTLAMQCTGFWFLLGWHLWTCTCTYIVQLKARTVSRKQLLINSIFVVTILICIYLWHEQINNFFLSRSIFCKQLSLNSVFNVFCAL